MTDRPEQQTDSDSAPSRDPDAAVAGLLREVAEGWTMPPQRLGQQTWRDRIAEPRARRPLLRPALAAFAMAAAATVALALGAVWLSSRPLPSAGVGASPSPGTPTSPGPSGAATSPSAGSPSPTGPSPTPLPALAIGDPALRSIAFPVQADGQQILDLSKGLDSTPISDAAGSRVDQLLPWGSATVCLCPRAVAGLTSEIASLTVRLVQFDRNGKVVTSRTVASYTGGVPDSRTNDQPVAVASSSSSDPNLAYLGWTIRRADGWASGIDVVDLRTARVTQTVLLPSWPLTGSLQGVSGPEARPTFADAPQAFVSPSGDRVVIEQVRGAYATATGGGLGDGVRQAPDHWSALIAGGRIGALTPFATGQGTLDPADCPWPTDEAMASDAVFVALCRGSPLAIRRVDLAGRPIGDLGLPTDNQSALVASTDTHGGIRYAWMPFSRMLLKLDLVAGRIVGQLQIPAPTASTGSPFGWLLGRLGRWIAPAADAKIFLEPALALAPDGSRLYLLGTTGTSPDAGPTGSTGLVVVDTRSLSVVATWAPTADFTSIAVSRDGRYVFVAGAPGLDASGASQGGSVTVYRATDGTVAGIVGELGSTYVTFEPALMP